MPASEPLPIATLQHELRNKISIILGSADMVEMNETLSPEGTEDIDRIRRACIGAIALIDSLSPPSPQA